MKDALAQGLAALGLPLSAHQQQPHFLAFVANTRGWFTRTSVRRYQLA